MSDRQTGKQKKYGLISVFAQYSICPPKDRLSITEIKKLKSLAAEIAQFGKP